MGVFFYGISIILNGCLNGGAFSMIFPHVGKIYGFNYAGELYGFVVLSTGISSIISATIYYVISHFSSDKSNNDGTYLIIFICGAVLNFFAIILAILESNEPFDFNENSQNNNNNESKKLLTSSTKGESKAE
jgi:MFS family permease